MRLEQLGQTPEQTEQQTKQPAGLEQLAQGSHRSGRLV
jgi:hypothetical protein